jgi:hypothetical protein
MSGRPGVSPSSMMVVTGAEDGTMKPEALSEEGGLLLEPLVVESDKSTIAQRLGDVIRC